MDRWHRRGHFKGSTPVSTSSEGPFVPLSELGPRGFLNERFQTIRKPEKIVRSESWTLPQRLDAVIDDDDDETLAFGRALKRELESWMQSRRIKASRKRDRVATTNVSLIMVDTRRRQFEIEIGRNNSRFQIHYPRTMRRGLGGQFLMKCESSPELKRVCERVNEFARTNKFNVLGQSVTSLLEEIIRTYDEQFGNIEKFQAMFRAHGVGEDSPPTTPRTSSDLMKPPSLTRIKTVDAFRRAWGRGSELEEGEEGKRRRSRRRRPFGMSNMYADEIESLTSPDAAIRLRRTKQRLIRECKHIFDSNSSSSLDVSLVNDSPFEWMVTMSDFRNVFDQDLQRHASLYKTEPEVVLNVRFPSQYPSRAPEIRIIRPILKMYSGRSCGGAFCVPELVRKGWGSDNEIARRGKNPEKRMLRLLDTIRDTLETHGRVDMETCNAYPRKYFDAAMSRIHARPDFEKALNVDGIFYVYSGTFARTQLELKIPETFESGNKVLLPNAVLQNLQRSNINNSTTMSRTTSSELGGGGLTFEITTPIGISSYCGVLQFTAPMANMIVLPDWMMKNMFTRNGMEVKLRSVELPKLTFVKVQPRRKEWVNVVKNSGLDHQTFMQQALQRYVSFSRGDDITLSVYGEEMSFSVIEIKPECAAGRLYDSFDAEVAFDVMEPLTAGNNNNIVDKDDENESKSTKRPTLSRTPSALERERKAANEAFERKWQEEQDQKAREERRRQVEGIAVQSFDVSKDTWCLRIRTHDGRSFVARVNPNSPCCELHDLIRKEAPTGLVPYILNRVGIGSSIPDERSTTMLQCKLEDGVSLSQDLRTGGLCDVCSDPATKSYVFGNPKDVVRLCDKHHCEWLHVMINGRQIDQDEASLLTKQIVLDNLDAKLC